MRMLHDEICQRLQRIEQTGVTHLQYEGLYVWPLLRFLVWQHYGAFSGPPAGSVASGLGRLLHTGRRLYSLKGRWGDLLRRNRRSDASIVFMSHPVYLQRWNASEVLIDKIADPLIQLFDDPRSVEKYYAGPCPENNRLFFPARRLFLLNKAPVTSVSDAFRRQLAEVARNAQVDEGVLLRAFEGAWRDFRGGYAWGKNLARTTPRLRTVYVVCWYTPERMGTIAALRAHGITTVELQHGKQGKFQGMYSWWDNFPAGGYEMVPDIFWCWGRKSCEHILFTASERPRHRPLLGGYAWPAFYNRHTAYHATPKPYPGGRSKHTVLVTLQNRSEAAPAYIPNFVLDYMRNPGADAAHFIFRYHPNQKDARDVCESVLGDLVPFRASIAGPDSNLYDQLKSVSHHVTAFSTCCYEASFFNVPTLLYGQNAQLIYDEEISARLFSWTPGIAEDLSAWLDDTPDHKSFSQDYFVSSLPLAKKMIEKISGDYTN